MLYECVMSDFQKEVFYGDLQEGKSSQHGQKISYKDTLKVPPKDLDLPMVSEEQTAQERSKLRGIINKGAALSSTKEQFCMKERESVKRKKSA